MRFRKPEPIPLIFIICATVLLFGLGVWQLQRLQWKQQQMAIVQRSQLEPVLGSLPPETDDLMYRNVQLVGTFIHEKTFHLVGNKRDAGAGFFIVTPFRLDDDGRIVLVNRGFSPEGLESTPQGPQSVSGIIRPNRQKRMFMPANQPDKNIWFYEDIPAMSAAVGEPVLPLMVEVVGKRQKGVFPIPGDGTVILRNDHLHYAITWFSIGLIGLVMFAFYHRVPEEEEEEV